jgi:hypothetical protein
VNAWSNIETSPQDPEIIEIDKFEKSLENISPNAQKIRELITRFEVCHFKYKQHFKNIKDSILNLKPTKNPAKIGANHISKGKSAWKKDKTGRSSLGHQYLCALTNWLDDHSQVKRSEHFNKQLSQQIAKWLGNKSPDKERLVRLLVARLTWDWKSYEEYQHGGEYKELEYQVCRMDICHYAFPKHLDSLLKGIGKMKPIKNFEGCSTFSTGTKTYIDKQFSILCDYLKYNIYSNNINPGKNEQIKLWLIACLAKTLKGQVGLKNSIPELANFKKKG